MNSESKAPATSKTTGNLRSKVPRTVKKIKKVQKKREFEIYIRRLMKIINENITISRDAMDVLNTLCMDIIGRILKEATDLIKYNRTSTLGIREIKSATKLVLPQELANYAIVDANKAWKKYTDSKIILYSANEDPMYHCTYIC